MPIKDLKFVKIISLGLSKAKRNKRLESGDEVELERWSEKGKEAVVELEERDKEERKEGGIGGGLTCSK